MFLGKSPNGPQFIVGMAQSISKPAGFPGHKDLYPQANLNNHEMVFFQVLSHCPCLSVGCILLVLSLLLAFPSVSLPGTSGQPSQGKLRESQQSSAQPGVFA